MSTVDDIDRAIDHVERAFGWAMDHWYIVVPLSLVGIVFELATMPWAMGLAQPR